MWGPRVEVVCEKTPQDMSFTLGLGIKVGALTEGEPFRLVQSHTVGICSGNIYSKMAPTEQEVKGTFWELDLNPCFAIYSLCAMG